MATNAFFFVGHAGVWCGTQIVKVLMEEHGLDDAWETGKPGGAGKRSGEYLEPFFGKVNQGMINSYWGEESGVAPDSLVLRAFGVDFSHHAGPKLGSVSLKSLPHLDKRPESERKPFPLPFVQWNKEGQGAANKWWQGYKIAAENLPAHLDPQFAEPGKGTLDSSPFGFPHATTFHIVHSCAGGTGSGAGTFLTEYLRRSRPDALILNYVIVPSKGDPALPRLAYYNAVLTLAALLGKLPPIPSIRRVTGTTKVSDAVFIFRNAALSRVFQFGHPTKPKSNSELNPIIAHFISNLTSCARFAGERPDEHERDISDIVTNLVPKDQRLVVPLLAPANETEQVRAINHLVRRLLSDDFNLAGATLKRGEVDSFYLGARGPLREEELHIAINQIQQDLEISYDIPFNQTAKPSRGYTHELWGAAGSRSVQALLNEIVKNARRDFEDGIHKPDLEARDMWGFLDMAMNALESYTTPIPPKAGPVVPVKRKKVVEK